MAGSVNKVILVGNLGADPEIRRLNSGEPVVNLRIATSESWRDKNSGDRKEKTEWHQVVIFNDNLAKVAEQYLKKGMKVYIEGQLQTRKWEKDGVERYTTEIVLQKFRGELQMLDSRGQGGEGGQVAMAAAVDAARTSASRAPMTAIAAATAAVAATGAAAVAAVRATSTTRSRSDRRLPTGTFAARPSRSRISAKRILLA